MIRDILFYIWIILIDPFRTLRTIFHMETSLLKCPYEKHAHKAQYKIYSDYNF